MFGSKPISAMRRLASWYGDNSRSKAWTFVPAKPAPVLMLDSSTYYQTFIYTREDQFVLVMDDTDVGSIPVMQILGPLGTEPLQVVDRTLESIRWYSNNQRQLGQRPRADWYEGVLVHMLRTLGRLTSPLLIEIEDQKLERAIQDVPAGPSSVVASLGTMGMRFKEAGNLAKAATARYWAGRAADAVDVSTDSRFVGKARIEYELAQELIDKGANVDFADDLVRRLADFHD